MLLFSKIFTYFFLFTYKYYNRTKHIYPSSTWNKVWSSYVEILEKTAVTYKLLIKIDKCSSRKCLTSPITKKTSHESCTNLQEYFKHSNECFKHFRIFCAPRFGDAFALLARRTSFEPFTTGRASRYASARQRDLPDVDRLELRRGLRAGAEPGGWKSGQGMNLHGAP